MCLERSYSKILFATFLFSSLLADCSYSQDSQARSTFENIYKSYDQTVDLDSGITHSQVEKWITKFWHLRQEYPNTTSASQATIAAYQLAVNVKDIAALDTLFKQTSIHEDAMAEILMYLPYTPIYEEAIPKLREIRRESNNPKVQASALIQSAKVLQSHRRYGQVAVILDSLSNWYNITNSHPKFGHQIEELRENIDKFSVGQKLDDFKTTTIDGNQFSNQDFEGRVTLIYFYNTGCGSCVAFLPTLNKLFETYKRNGLSLLGVSADSPYMTEEEFRDELEEHNINWPQSLDIDLFTEYKIRLVSTVFLINQNRELVLTSESKNVTQAISSLKGLSLEEAIKELLKI